MNKIVFRPFWSYDVIATERWLSKMHSLGYALDKVNFNLRLFYFVKTEPADYDYKISYEKKSDGKPSADLSNYAYETICFASNYTVIRTAYQSGITMFYGGFLDRNKRLRTFASIVLIIALCFSVLPAVIIAFVLIAILTGNFTDEPSASGSMMPHETDAAFVLVPGIWSLLILLVMIWVIYTYFKLGSSNKMLEGFYKKPIYSINNIINKSEERSLIKNKIIFKVKKFAWFYSPDKMEKWLEDMESQGNHLYKINDWGNSFYFMKSQPRNVKYCIDFQNSPKQAYFDRNIKNGWILVFNTISHLQSQSIWFKSYSGELPVFYADRAEKLKSAKRLAFNYSICFLPAVVLYMALIVMDLFFRKVSDGAFWLTIAAQMLITFEFGYFSFEAILYYFRVKKSCEGQGR